MLLFDWCVFFEIMKANVVTYFFNKENKMCTQFLLVIVKIRTLRITKTWLKSKFLTSSAPFSIFQKYLL